MRKAAAMRDDASDSNFSHVALGLVAILKTFEVPGPRDQRNCPDAEAAPERDAFLVAARLFREQPLAAAASSAEMRAS